MRNDAHQSPKGSMKAIQTEGYSRTDKASYLTLVKSPGPGHYFESSSGLQYSQALRAPFSLIENKLSLMYRSIASEKNRGNDISIVNESRKAEIRIAFPAIVFYTVMEELIENAFKFSLGKSPVQITFSEVEDKLRIAIINQGSFSRGSSEASDFFEAQAPSKLSFGIGLALTNKLCKYYNSHFAVYQNLENLILTLEIPINFK